MKKLLILSFLFLGSYLCSAQKKYDKLWTEVEKLELEGKYKNASAVVTKILKKAGRSNNSQHIVKAFIYKSKFSLEAEESIQKRIILDLEAAIKKYDFPTNALLESVYAGYLEQYLNKNRYQISNRTPTEFLEQSNEFEKWDINTFIYQIDRHYRASLTEEKKLQKLSVEDYETLLSESNTSAKFRPTLYDFLAHRAIKFYAANKWYVKRPKGRFYLNSPAAFALTTDFIKESFYTKDSVLSGRSALKLYQKLEAFHKNGNTLAYVDLMLNRLQFSRSKAIISNKETLYLKALQELSKKFDEYEASSFINYQIADYLFQKTKKSKAKKNPSLKNLRVQALKICEKVLSKFPNSDGGLLCEILKKNIEEPSIAIETEKYLVPNKPFLAKVTSKSLDSLYLSIYKVNHATFQNSFANERDSMFVDLITSKKADITRFYQLQSKKDYYEYTTEVDLPKLAQGTYVILASTDAKIERFDQLYSYSIVTVSNLSFVTMNHNNTMMLKVLNRDNGSNVQNAQISIIGKDFQKNGVTNKNGEFKIKKDDKYHSKLNVQATYQGDSLTHTGFSIYRSYYDSDDEDDEKEVKMSLFLDRSIYRPGQTVFFKGILIERKGEISKVVPNTYVSIVISDANNNDLKEYRLKTNEYGSVSGEYQLPKNVLTGEFTIEIDEDYGTDEEDGDKYYDDVNNSESTEIYFSVEEYKRPKFEITFDNITENYLLGDSIKVKASAKALLGSAISDAQVSYTITRELVPNYRLTNYRAIKDQILKTGTTKTDKKGDFIIEFIATPDSLAIKEEKPIFAYQIELDVTDINGETRSNSKSVLVGYHNLTLDFQMSTKINKNVKQAVSIETENLNGEHIDTEVVISVYKLSSPDRVLRRRPWNVPEVRTLSRDRFIELFPNEVYDSTDLKKHWKKGELVFSSNFKNKRDNPVTLEKIQDWASGAYVIEVKAKDVFDETVIKEKAFEVFSPEDTELSYSKLFDHQIVNSKYKEDGYVLVRLRTSAKHLNVNLEAFYENVSVFKKTVIIEDNNKLIKIPVKKSYKGEMHFNAYFTKFNSFSNQRFSAYFVEQEETLNIETLSFRNKLTPDQPESWSFKITGSNQKPAQSEVLASMYDTSLDQFQPHSWDVNIDFYKYNNYYAPRMEERGLFQKNRFRVLKRFGQYRDMSSVIRNYHQLNWFGFNFGEQNYANKIYLARLKNRLKSKKHPPGTISGVVMDRDGALPAVSVSVKGTKIGTETDFDGFYTLNVPKGSEILFQYLGYKTDSIVVTKAGTYNILLEEGGAVLDEIVVTAQGIKRHKKKLSASVSYVNAVTISDDIERKLAGVAAGVQIVDADGSPGVASKVVIRGLSSVAENKAPLYVVDGVPLDLAMDTSLASADISDITVLKGASATSLYGTRGANGVVIITTKKGLEELTQVEARTNLQETAFFFPHITTNKKGEISFSFDSPQALTKWRLMLFAHSKSLETGGLEKFAVTQKEINVIPNLPRFLREKDTVEIRVKIVNLTNDRKAGTALLQLFDAVTMKPISQKEIAFKQIKTFNANPKESASIHWKLSIPEGLQALQYKIVAKSGKYSDGEQGILPVLSNRILVTESKPLWVRPGTTQKVTFDKLEKPVSKTQTNHKYTLEYTSNPSWLAIKSLPYLIEFPHECAEQTFSKFFANKLASHILESNPKIEDVFKSWKDKGQITSALEENEDLKSIFLEESPWVRDLQNDSEQKARLTQLFDKEKVKETQLLTISKLKKLQLPSGGFPWFGGGRESEFITRHIISGIGHLDKLDTKTSIDYNMKLILKKAIKYLDLEFMNRYNRITRNVDTIKNGYLDHHALHYLYARSFHLDSHPLSEELKKIVSIYLTQGKESWLQLSLYNKTLLALSAFRHGDEQISNLIMEALQEQAVISNENGMYWKENTNSWYWYRSPVETQALIIEAFAEIKKDKKIIDQLKQWLLKRKQTNRWSTTKATTEAIYALLSYGTDWLSVSDNTVIKIGEEKIKTKKLSSVKKEAGTGYLKLDWKKEEITSKMSTVSVKNKSNVLGYGGVFWQYFEELDQVSSSDASPLQIKKSVLIKRTNNDEESFVPLSENSAIKIGDLVRVRIEITSKDDMEFIHLKDLRASGLEPIDVISKYKWQDGLGYYQSTKDVSTHFFFDRLPKGTYIFEYDLRANNSGNFSNGITTIQSMYAPEFSSHTKGIRIQID